MVIRCIIVMYCFINLSILSMELELTSVSQKSTKIPQDTFLDMLPLEIQGLIGSFLWQLNNVDFDTIDYYEKFIFKEKNPINDTTIYYEDEKPLTMVERRYGMIIGGQTSYIDKHIYENKGIILYGGTGVSLTINHLHKQCIIKKKSEHNDLILQCFSPHHNLFGTRTIGNIIIRNINNGKVIFWKNINGSSPQRIYFGLNESVIKIYKVKGSCYKLYFDNPTKKLLISTSFTWREMYLICTIFCNNSECKPSIISKKSADYIIYKELSKDIRIFLEKYLNVKIKK
jgi:hypothetical protein